MEQIANFTLQARMATSHSRNRQFLQTSGATDPVWIHRDKYADRPKLETLKSSIKAEVCIVGGGIAGISIARDLVARGKDVVLLEARDIVSGETGRTSGHLSTALDDHYTEIKKKHGGDGAKAAAESHSWAINHVGEIVEDPGIDCRISTGARL